MGFLTIAQETQPIMLVGKAGTGKSTTAIDMLPNANRYFANLMPELDIYSLTDEGIIIEDVHYKANIDLIKSLIIEYSGPLVLTCHNEKDIPSEIKTLCKIKRVGSKNYLREEIKTLAPRSSEPYLLEDAIFGIVMEYLRETDRDKVAHKLKVNKPSDTQIMSWLNENIHPNRLIYVDARVRRRLPMKYFYEMLAYLYDGRDFNRPQFPKRGTYSKIPGLCRRLRLKSHEEYLLRDLVKDEVVSDWAKTKLNNAECRLLGLGEKRRKKKTDRVIPKGRSSLTEWL